MCEFCPSVGRCNMCDSFVGVPQPRPAERVRRRVEARARIAPVLSAGRYRVSYQGVSVLFDSLRDAESVVTAIPLANIYPVSSM